jgi:ribonuclease P protein component
VDQAEQGRRPASFPKARRLLRKADFSRVFDLGHRVQGRYFTMLLAPAEAPAPRLGIVASRKLGDAVHRNRAKRVIREIFRQTPPLPGRQGVDVVVIPRRELFDAAYSSLERDFRHTLERGLPRLGAPRAR